MQVTDIVRKDRPLAVAFLGAAMAYNVLAVNEGDPPSKRGDWALLKTDGEDTGEDASFTPVADVLAPFVRQHPEAPAEALYRHAQGKGVHDGSPDGWNALPLPLRVAYSIFAQLLRYADTELKAEQDRKDAAQRQLEAARREPTTIAQDERTLQQVSGVGDRIDLGEAADPKMQPARGRTKAGKGRQGTKDTKAVA